MALDKDDSLLSNETKNAVVIGAGPAGLTAAYELAKNGIRSTVLEADQLVGGISRTVNYKGYRFDIGGHRFFSKVPLINEVWDDILDEKMLIRPRLSRIHYRDHFFDYPLQAGNALSGLGLMEAVMIGLSYARTKVFPSRQERNFEEWVANRFGYRLYNIFFKTYTEKVWGIPCTEISADWAAQRIKNLSLVEAVRNALLGGGGKTKDGKIITTLIDEFKYPRLGPGMMWECCETRLEGQGSRTLRGRRVERVRHTHGKVECVYARTDDGELEEFSGDQFFSTMPLRELIGALDPAPPDDVIKAANSLAYRDYLTVVLMVKRDKVFPDNWIYIHSPEVKMGRIQNYKNWSPEMVPDASRTSLGLEYFLWDVDDEWTWSNDRLIDLGLKETVALKLIEADEVEDGTVVRMKKAYPIYDQFYQGHLDVIRRYLDTITNLQTIGRNGQHRYNNQDHSMLTGIYAARNVVGANYDIWSVNVEKEYHEETVRDEKATGDRMIPRRLEPSDDAESLAPDAVIRAAFAKLDPVAMGSAVGLVFAVSLFLATVALIIKGGEVVGPHLSLLGHYLIGYKVTWSGAFLGLIESGISGFLLGYTGASLRNWTMSTYSNLLKRRADIDQSKDLLDKV